ncbi:MAG: hypothetical protein R3C68_00960 [Myxococcota bacterium]
MPVVLLVLFGYGVSFDMDSIPLVILDSDHTRQSREIRDAFVTSENSSSSASSTHPVTLNQRFVLAGLSARS